MRSKSIVAGLVVGALALPAPAVGSAAEPPTSSTGVAQLAQHRSGGQATGTAVRRDGEHAAAFVAELSPPASVAGDGDAFDWGAAAIGAGAALFVTALLMAGPSVIGGRRRQGRSAASRA
jgi:hypothetical protein